MDDQLERDDTEPLSPAPLTPYSPGHERSGVRRVVENQSSTGQGRPVNKRAWSEALLIVGVVALVVGAVTGTFSPGPNDARTSSPEAATAAAQDGGLDDDGGPMLRSAWEWLDTHGQVDDRLFFDVSRLSNDEFRALPDERHAAMRTAVERLRPFIDKIMLALQKPRWRTREPDENDWISGGTIPDVRNVYKTARVLTVALRELPATAPPARRAALLGALARLGARWEGRTVESAWTTSCSIQSNALTALRDALADRLVAPDDVRRAFSDVLECDPRQRLDEALRLNRDKTINVVRRLIGDDTRPVVVFDKTLNVNTDAESARLSRASLDEYAREIDTLIADHSASLLDLAVRTRHFANPSPQRGSMTNVGAGVSRSSAMAVPRHVNTATRLAAQQRLALCALAALDHRAASGSWPTNLDALDVAPDARIDPYQDAPFTYEVRPDGNLWIASIGPPDVGVWGRRPEGAPDPERLGLVWRLPSGDL